MADISVERKPRSSLPLILGILLVVALAAAGWWYYQNHRTGDATPPAAPAPGTATP